MNNEELKITLDKNLLNNKDIDFFHYGKQYELAKYNNYTFIIASRGELKIEYQTENYSTRNYNDIVRYYVKNNNDYIKSINNGNLNIMLGNWFEIEIINKKGEYICNLYDECFFSIKECLKMLKKAFKNTVDISNFI